MVSARHTHPEADFGQVNVLDPTGEAPLALENQSTGTTVGSHDPIESLAGKVVGFRLDVYWVSWNFVAEEWAAMAAAEGARVTWWRHRPPVGKDVESLRAGLAAFVDDLDLGVFGMCNCGACTMWTVEEAITAIRRGRRTIVVSTDHFVSLAQTLASRDGHPDIPIKVLPFPLEGLPESDVRRIAREHYPSFVSLLKDAVPAR